MTLQQFPSAAPDPMAVPITLDRPRVLRWTHEAVYATEHYGRINLRRTSVEDAQRLFNPDLTLLSAMLYGALVHEDRTLTIEDAIRFVYEHDDEMILEKVVEAYKRGRPQKKGKEATPDPPKPIQNPSGGSTSLPTPESTSASAPPSSGV